MWFLSAAAVFCCVVQIIFCCHVNTVAQLVFAFCAVACLLVVMCTSICEWCLMRHTCRFVYCFSVCWVVLDFKSYQMSMYSCILRSFFFEWKKNMTKFVIYSFCAIAVYIVKCALSTFSPRVHNIHIEPLLVHNVRAVCCLMSSMSEYPMICDDSWHMENWKFRSHWNYTVRSPSFVIMWREKCVPDVKLYYWLIILHIAICLLNSLEFYIKQWFWSPAASQQLRHHPNHVNHHRATAGAHDGQSLCHSLARAQQLSVTTHRRVLCGGKCWQFM